MGFPFPAPYKKGGFVLKELIPKSLQTMKALATRQVRIECDRIPYHFHNVPLKKLLNWILVEISIYFKPEHPWGWPTHLQIEPTNRCNLRCALCPVTAGMDRPNGHMDLNVYKKIVDEIGDYVFLILLWDWGEPFLNPSIYEMISYAKQKGIKLVSSTNGHLFKDGEQAARLVASGLDSIIFAVDGISQETYELYRQGGSLESVLQGIRTVVARKRNLKSRTPLINLRFIVMKHRHEFEHGRSFARVRMKSQNFSKWKRLFYGTFSFLIPGWLLLKIALRNLRNRIYLFRFLKASPLLMLGLIFWSLGEYAVYVKGSASLAREFC